MLIINADDVGRSTAETDAALRCFHAGRISSGSFMAFMADSERAARLVREANLDVGLHLNFTELFTAATCPVGPMDAPRWVALVLSRNRYAQLVYNPFLRKQFAESYGRQVAEFVRLFGELPSHLDGHHHMHLCANFLLSGFPPKSAKMRRNFSFWPGEKSWLNRLYRRTVDRWLERRYRLTEFFFDLTMSLKIHCLDRALALAGTGSVELMTHPTVKFECEFLISDAFPPMLRGLDIGSYRHL